MAKLTVQQLYALRDIIPVDETVDGEVYTTFVTTGLSGWAQDAYRWDAAGKRWVKEPMREHPHAAAFSPYGSYGFNNEDG